MAQLLGRQYVYLPWVLVKILLQSVSLEMSLLTASAFQGEMYNRRRATETLWEEDMISDEKYHRILEMKI